MFICRENACSVSRFYVGAGASSPKVTSIVLEETLC